MSADWWPEWGEVLRNFFWLRIAGQDHIRQSKNLLQQQPQGFPIWLKDTEVSGGGGGCQAHARRATLYWLSRPEPRIYPPHEKPPK